MPSIGCCWLGLGLVAGCGGGETRICFGDASFCERAFTPTRNAPPQADAGADRDAVAGQQVILDGSSSLDPDGTIASFSWIQTRGFAVVIQNADEAIARFVAPSAAAPEVLEFRLTVVDDDDAADQDDVIVTVAPAAALAAAAVTAGLELLTESLTPWPAIANGACADATVLSADSRLAAAGLWFAARVAGLGSDSDNAAVSRFLDAARVIVGNAETPDAASRAAGTFWRFGLGELASFAAYRDPALAVTAQRLAGASPDTDMVKALIAGELNARLADGGTIELSKSLPPTARDSAVAYLLDTSCASRADPLRTAADTLVLMSWLGET